MNKKKIKRRNFCKAGMASLAALGLNALFPPGYSRKEEAFRAADELPNFIIFLVDKLRPDHLGIYGYPKNISPNIDKLARQGIVFENAYAPCPWTYPSVVSLLTGLVPASYRTIYRRKEMVIPRPDFWLPMIFKRHGYATVGFHTHPFLRKEASNIHLGFEEYYDPSQEKRRENRFSDYMYLDTLYPACERWLEENCQRRFFMYVHVIDVHGPYNMMRLLDEDKPRFNKLVKEGYEFPRSENGMFASSSPFPYRQKSFFYDGHIFSVDQYFARLFARLQTLGIGENTVLVFTSDHGEGFGEHDCWHHGLNVYEDQIRIPLIFYSHKGVKERAGRITGLVNTVGLIPSLLEMIGVNIDKNIDGKSFLPLITSDDKERRYVSMSDWCRKKHGGDPDAFMMDTDFKLITPKTEGGHHLFNLKEDPHERRPITLAGRFSPRDKEKLKYLVRERRKFLNSIKRKKSTIRTLDKDEMEDLKTLGYL
jgi:arylsulfatase A-like enzyme